MATYSPDEAKLTILEQQVLSIVRNDLEQKAVDQFKATIKGTLDQVIQELDVAALKTRCASLFSEHLDIRIHDKRNK